MKKLLLLAFTIVAVSTSLCAGNISEQAAEEIARQFLLDSHVNRRAGQFTPQPVLSLAHKAKAADGVRTYYYAFNNQNGGFVIVSGDDRTDSLIGYGDNGKFDVNDIPDGMQELLHSYQEQMDILDTKGTMSHRTPSNFLPIEPMIETKWGQGSPYNYHHGNMPAGCVATAMAQVMNYYKWPQGEINKDNLNNVTIQWDLLKNEYKENDSSESAYAVADLMDWCGTAVGMNYMPTVSSAKDFEVPDAMAYYFSYDDDIQTIYRPTYSAEEWDEKLYNELANERVVLYSAHPAGTNSGHMFICDGYDGNGLFHINWGWDGRLDGFFKLSILDGNYTVRHSAIINIKKSETSTDEWKPYISKLDFKNFYVLNEENDYSFTCFLYLWTSTPNPEDVESNLALYDKDRFIAYCCTGEQLASSDTHRYYKYAEISHSIPDGRYQLKVVYRKKGTEQWKLPLLGNARLFELTKTGNVMSIEYKDYDKYSSYEYVNCQINDISTEGSLLKYSEVKVIANVTNLGNENAGIIRYTCTHNHAMVVSGQIGVHIDPQKSDNVVFKFKADEGGQYVINFYNGEDENDFLETYTVTIDDSDKPYAILGNWYTLKFYYDSEQLNREGELINLENLNSVKKKVDCVIFDSSFVNYSELTSLSSWFKDFCYLHSISGFGNINMEKVTDMSHMFEGCTRLDTFNSSGLNTENVRDMSHMFEGCSSLTSVNIDNLNTENVRDMSYMFDGCTSLGNLNLSQLSLTNVTSMDCMFNNCSKLKIICIGNNDNWDTSNVVSSSNMFNNCTSIVGFGGVTYDPDHIDVTYAKIGDGGYFWDVSPSSYGINANGTVTFYYDSFNREGQHFSWSEEEKESVTKIVFDPSFIFANISCKNLFYGFSSLVTIEGIQYLNTKDETSMNGMFRYCSSLEYLDLSSLNTSNVTDMSYMFEYCSSLTSLNVSGLNAKNVTQMYNMFHGCNNLTSLNLTSFKTEKLIAMNRMFSGCSALTSLDLSSFNTANVTSIYGLFESCSSLVSINLGNFSTESMQMMSYAFKDCESLLSIDLSSFVLPGRVNTNNMFKNCKSLNIIYVNDNWDGNNVFDSEDMFIGCINLLGGKGTKYDSSYTNGAYAHIDEGVDNPGYFTKKVAPGTPGYYKLVFILDDEVYKTLYLEEGESIIPELIPTKDGYIFSGIYDVPSSMPDHDVIITGTFDPLFNIGDVVNSVSIVMKVNVTEEELAMYDMNHDNELNIGDVILIVKSILKYSSRPNSVIRRAPFMGDLSQYTAAQFEIKADRSVDMSNIHLVGSMAQSHKLMYSQIDAETYAVVVFSFSNQLMKPENGRVVEVDGANVMMQNIIVSNTSGETYNYQNMDISTGVSNWKNENKPATIYDLKGNRLDGKGLKSGLYIINGKKAVVK